MCNITHSCEASTKFCVFMSMQPVYIDLVHRPTSGCSEVKSCMSGYSYSTFTQCCYATVTVANKSGLLGHTFNRSCLCYSLLLVRAGACLHLQLSAYSLILRLSPLANEKSFPYCKQQNTGRGLRTRLARYILSACNVD